MTPAALGRDVVSARYVPTALTITKSERVRIYIALQRHKGYDRLSPRQQELIDCFAAGMGYVETGKVMGVKRSAPYSMLTKTILPRYKPGIWKLVNNLPAALKLLASEVKAYE